MRRGGPLCGPAFLFFPLSGTYLALLGFTFPLLPGSFYTRTVLNQFSGG